MPLLNRSFSTASSASRTSALSRRVSAPPTPTVRTQAVSKPPTPVRSAPALSTPAAPVSSTNPFSKPAQNLFPRDPTKNPAAITSPVTATSALDHSAAKNVFQDTKLAETANKLEAVKHMQDMGVSPTLAKGKEPLLSPATPPVLNKSQSLVSVEVPPPNVGNAAGPSKVRIKAQRPPAITTTQPSNPAPAAPSIPKDGFLETPGKPGPKIQQPPKSAASTVVDGPRQL